jgi:hypothetical protein
VPRRTRGSASLPARFENGSFETRHAGRAGAHPYRATCAAYVTRPSADTSIRRYADTPIRPHASLHIAGVKSANTFLLFTDATRR